MTCERDFAYSDYALQSSKMAQAVLNTADDYILCNECGTQFPFTEDAGKTDCRVCDVSIPRKQVNECIDLLFSGSATIRACYWSSMDDTCKIENSRT